MAKRRCPHIQTKKLTILLTRYPSALIRFLCWYSRSEYLHAAVGFEEDFDVFYSFGFKGYRIERVTHGLKPGREPLPCALYELDVPERIYENVKCVLQDFEQRKDTLSYTKLGAAFALLRLGCRWENHYFCSQFVADVLSRSKAVRLPKDSSLYLPQELSLLPGVREAYRGDTLGFVRRYVPQAAC